MRNVRALVVGVLMVGGLAGCRNRVAEENEALWQQTREQQAAIDRQNEELAAKRKAEADALAARPQPVQPPVAPPPPTPTPPVTPPAPAPERPLDVGSEVEVSRNPSEGTVTLNLSSDIFFDAGAATIKPAARASLDKVAAALKREYTGKEVRVEGHTDSDPIKRSKWKSNQELSEARAKSVRDYLVKKGVDAGSVLTLGHGADKPRGSDKAKNRRVEVVVLVDADAPNARPTGAATTDDVEDNK